MTTIGIAGITGQLGHLIAEELVQNHKVHLKGFGRDVNKLPEALKTKTEFITGQADDLDSLHRFIKGCDVVICCYSGDATLMINGQKRLIDLCEREGITRYIASDYTMDYRKLAMGQFPFKDAQKHIFNYLETKKHVKGVHILTNWFMDLMFSEFAPFWNASKKSFSFWGDENAVLEATTFVNTAQYVAAVALDRDAVGFKCCKSGQDHKEYFFLHKLLKADTSQFLVTARVLVRSSL